MVMMDIARQPPARSDRSVAVVAVLDGFYGCGSGAGWSNRALIEILAEVLPVDIDLVVLPARVDAVSGRWQQEWRRVVEQALGRSGRRVEVRGLEVERVAWERESLRRAALAAVGEGVDLSPYQRRLAGRVAHEQLDVSLLTRFSPRCGVCRRTTRSWV